MNHMKLIEGWSICLSIFIPTQISPSISIVNKHAWHRLSPIILSTQQTRHFHKFLSYLIRCSISSLWIRPAILLSTYSYSTILQTSQRLSSLVSYHPSFASTKISLHSINIFSVTVSWYWNLYLKKKQVFLPQGSFFLGTPFYILCHFPSNRIAYPYQLHRIILINHFSNSLLSISTLL